MVRSHKYVITCLGILLVSCAVLFQFYPQIDLYVSRHFFDPSNVHRFPLMYDPLLRFIQKAVDWVAYALIIILISILAILSFFKTEHSILKQIPLSRIQAGFLLLALALGPGLMVQLATKEVFDRPRPVYVKEFTGPHEFVPPFVISEVEAGKSFVSGHAAMGFYLAAFALLIACPKKRGFFYIAAIAAGIALGSCRIIQGRHFFSDVLFSGIMTLMLVHASHWLIYHRYSADKRPTEG